MVSECHVGKQDKGTRAHVEEEEEEETSEEAAHDDAILYTFAFAWLAPEATCPSTHAAAIEGRVLCECQAMTSTQNP